MATEETKGAKELLEELEKTVNSFYKGTAVYSDLILSMMNTGEDRIPLTPIMKEFMNYSQKFIPDHVKNIKNNIENCKKAIN